jgi:hypothetical protein
MTQFLFRATLILVALTATAFAQDGNLTVESKPSGTTVVLEGEYELAGVTPVTFHQNLFGRYKLTARRGGYEDYSTTVVLTGSQPKIVTFDMVPRTRFKAAIRSIVLPGWGQIYSGQKLRGGLYTFGTVLSLLAFAVADDDFRDKRNSHDDLLDEYNNARSLAEMRSIKLRLDDAQQEAYDAESFKRVTIGVVAFIWAFNVLDAALFFPESGYSIGGPASISLNTGEEFDRLQLNLAVRF